MAVVLVGMVLGIACTSDPAAIRSTLCSAARTATGTCKEPSSCDTTLTAQCTSLGKAVSSSTLDATMNCLESGVCGVANCLTRARKSAAPSRAHLDLATSFCASCSADVTDCEAQFYAKNAKLPGALVLPYSDAVVVAVADACTTDPKTCRSKFTTCATETIARVVGDTLDSELADCVLSGFRADDGANTGPDGGPETSTCTADNCKGCCRNDQCEEGTSKSTCGVGGAACETCGSALNCTAGQCKEPCGPNNCKGCCRGDTCVTGNANDACGGDGEACSACTAAAASLVCSNHTCIDSSCQSTCVNGCCSATGCQSGTAASACGTGGEACIDCGYGRICSSAKACAIDPNATWDVYVAFAIVPSKNKDGASWDVLNGAPDPYLIAYSNQLTGQTSVQNDTTLPYWGETVLKGVKASALLADLSFEVWDSDYDFDDFIGGCAVPLTTSVFDGSLQDYTCPAGASSVAVDIYYRIQASK